VCLNCLIFMDRSFGGKFGINRGKEIECNFGYNFLSAVNVGREGQKIIAEIQSRKGTHGRYFFKQMFDDEESFEQLEKYRHFKEGGVSVPPVFKPVRLEGNKNFVIISDLTEDEKYWVLSRNNPEVDTDEFKKLAKSIPQETRDKIIQQLILACEVAVKPKKDKQGKEIIYQLQGNAFFLALNSADAADSRVYVGDFGIDVMERKSTEANEVIKRNIRSAAAFYSWMTGEPFIVPEEYKNMEGDLDEGFKEILEYRKFD